MTEALGLTQVSPSQNGPAVGKVTGIVQPLLAAIPYEVPFRNTDISASSPLDADFPVLDLNWTFFGATDAGLSALG